MFDFCSQLLVVTQELRIALGRPRYLCEVIIAWLVPDRRSIQKHNRNRRRWIHIVELVGAGNVGVSCTVLDLPRHTLPTPPRPFPLPISSLLGSCGVDARF